MRKFLFLLFYCVLFFLPALLPAQVFDGDRMLKDFPEEETRGLFRSFEDYFDDDHSLSCVDGLQDSVTISGLEYRSLTRVPDGFVEEIGDMVDAGTPIGSLIVVIGVFGLLLLLVTALLALAGLAVESWKAFSKTISKKKDDGGSPGGTEPDDWRMAFKMPFCFTYGEHSVFDADGTSILSFEFDTTPSFRTRVLNLLNGIPGQFEKFPSGTFVQDSNNRFRYGFHGDMDYRQCVFVKAVYDENMNLIVEPESVMELIQEPPLLRGMPLVDSDDEGNENGEGEEKQDVPQDLLFGLYSRPFFSFNHGSFSQIFDADKKLAMNVYIAARKDLLDRIVGLLNQNDRYARFPRGTFSPSSSCVRTISVRLQDGTSAHIDVSIVYDENLNPVGDCVSEIIDLLQEPGGPQDDDVIDEEPLNTE